MLKIIHLKPPAKLPHQCVQYFLSCTSFVNENRKIGRKNDLFTRKTKNVIQNSILSGNRPENKCGISSVYNISHLDQKRNFSFKSSVESLTQTQSGVFKALSECALVEQCQNFLMFIHDISGLHWWGTLVGATIILRTFVTFPLAVYQQYVMAKLQNLQLELPDLVKELKKETAIAVKMYGWDEKTARATYNRSLRKQYNNLIIRENCHPLKTTILLWVQIPMWISVSISLRNFVYMMPHQDLAAQIVFAQFSAGGFGFIPNLTVPDQSWIFPVALGILNLAIIEIQQLSRPADKQKSKLQKFATNTFRIISIVMIPIAASVPSCLALYWTTSSAYGLFQNLLLLSPRVRRALWIPQTENEVKEPYRMILMNLKKKLKLS